MSLPRPHRLMAPARPLPAFVPLLLFGGPAFTVVPAEAQNPAATLEAPFVHEVWTVQNGLPINSITDVVHGHGGYLWFATWDGLVRFDGLRFTVFSTSNTDELPSSRIVGIIDDSSGTLWIRTEQHHLIRLREGVFTHLDARHGFDDRHVLTVSAGAGGRLWVGTDRGIGVVRGGGFVPLAEGTIRGPVSTLLEGSDGVLWVGMRHGGVYRVEDGTATSYGAENGLDATWITALAEDRRGTVWVGSNDGIHHFNEGRFERTSRSDGAPFRAYVRTLRAAPGEDAVWIEAEEGLYVARGMRLHLVRETPGELSLPVVRFDGSGAVWYSVADRLYRNGVAVFQIPPRAHDAHPMAEIRSFTWDHEGSLWIATHSSGLFRLKPSVFRTYSEAEGLTHRNVAAVLQDRSGAVWIGTQGGGLNRIAGEKFTRYSPERGFPAHVISLLQDRSGDLWAGTYRLGILHCRLPVMSCGPPPGGQPAPEAAVHALHQDAEGHTWAGTDAGLFRLRDGGWERLDAGEAPLSAVVRVFLQARDGTLWMGTNGNGLLAYRRGRFSRITAADGLPSDLVRALHEDGRGRLWVGTEGRGLARLAFAASAREGIRVLAMHTIRRRDGLFDDVIHQILEDGAGRLWMSTNRGIFWVDLAELDAFVAGRIPRIHSSGYTERDGMRNREANGGFQPAGIRAQDGRLWFPTQDGVVVADPSATRRNLVLPPVVIEKLVVRDREVRPGTETILLAAGERDFEIDYTALSFLAPENVRFRYRLEGLDRDWVDAGNRRTAYYTNVPPGTYTFRVIASNNEAIWNEAGATVTFRVAPRFHETGIAYLLLLLTLGLLGLTGFHWRMYNLRRQERQLMRLVETRTAQLREHEAQLEAQNAQLALQAEQLTELDRAKSHFFANLSHEFRTPLTLIMGPLRGLLDGRHGVLSESGRYQSELIQRNAQRLLRLVNHVLDLAKLQAGQLTLHLAPHDLVAFTHEATLAFAPLAERQGVELRFHSPERRLPLAFDRDQLEKVIFNLLSNALKFTPAGGAVDVSLRAGDATAEIVVRDTGEGIADEDLRHLFERFYQGGASAARSRGGTGIGLALARELVELHGGEIQVDSMVGGGSTFTVRLPRDGSPDPSRGAAAGTVAPVQEGLAAEAFSTGAGADLAEEAEPVDAAGDTTTVLVVDDNPDVRAYLRSILAPRFRVLEAADGRGGLARAQAALPDLIVADVMMPTLDGLSLGRALKENPMTDAIPLVLLTARAAPEDHIAGLDSGADAYLVKPFEPGVLEACVGNLLTQRRRLRERFRLGEATPPSADPVVSSALEQKLRPLVIAHLTDLDFGPDSLAAAASLSYHQLYRLLRDELDTTPSRFIRGVRADCAAELLRQRAGTITEVAYSVGFHSLSYFGEAFRERFGVSPSELLAARPSEPV